MPVAPGMPPLHQKAGFFHLAAAKKQRAARCLGKKSPQNGGFGKSIGDPGALAPRGKENSLFLTFFYPVFSFFLVQAEFQPMFPWGDALRPRFLFCSIGDRSRHRGGDGDLASPCGCQIKILPKPVKSRPYWENPEGGDPAGEGCGRALGVVASRSVPRLRFGHAAPGREEDTPTPPPVMGLLVLGEGGGWSQYPHLTGSTGDN